MVRAVSQTYSLRARTKVVGAPVCDGLNDSAGYFQSRKNTTGVGHAYIQSRDKAGAIMSVEGFVGRREYRQKGPKPKRNMA